MQTTDIRPGSKSSTIRNIVESRYGLPIDSNDPQHLIEMRDHYRSKCDDLMVSLGQFAAFQHPDYAKARFISEAAQMILREIAPKRRKRQSRPNS